jgi:hypothetical protein
MTTIKERRIWNRVNAIWRRRIQQAKAEKQRLSQIGQVINKMTSSGSSGSQKLIIIIADAELAWDPANANDWKNERAI